MKLLSCIPAGALALAFTASLHAAPPAIGPIAQQAYLKAHQVNTGDSFSRSVAVSGETVVVGAFAEASSTTGVNSTPNENAFAAGAAYVFVCSGTNWEQQAYLKAHQVNASDVFGISVAVSGDTVVVGATGEDSSTTGVNSTPNDTGGPFVNAGAAYVFVRSGTNWTQQAYLKAHQVNARDAFGASVAVSGDTVVVGALGEASSTTGVNSTPNESAVRAGAAYVFVRSGTNWTQQAYLKAHQVKAEDRFGGSVAVSGDTVVVGAPFEDSSTTGVNSTPNESASSAGAAYVFVRNGTNWTQQAYLKAHQVNANDYFGGSVAVSGDTVVVGVANESTLDAGAAYVFVRNGTNWTQQAYLKAHQVNASDYFGESVAVSGDTVVVGASQEDSSTTGVNGTPNESAVQAGAAYVFVRTGTNWTQRAYLKAHQVSAFDLFGNSVAVSGDTVVVGALYEASSTTGVNSTPNENADDAGAAYVFTLPQDSDSDGVLDADDECPDSPPGAIVDATGCSIEQLVPCDAPWRNHGQYVRALQEVTARFVSQGLITAAQGHAILKQGATSDCGKRSRVTRVNPFQFQFDGGSRSAFEVEASTNLADWVFIGNATNLSGSLFQFTDSSVTNFPSRFYRLKVP